jgi:hypothetical protein
MLSDVTIDLGGRMITITGADLVLLLVGVFVISVVVVMAFSRGRRLEAAYTRSADILIVQLERIGDTLDRIVSQNTALLAAMKEKSADVPVARPALPLIALASAKADAETIDLEPSLTSMDCVRQDSQCLPLADESQLNETVRSVVSMLRP